VKYRQPLGRIVADREAIRRVRAMAGGDTSNSVAHARQAPGEVSPMNPAGRQLSPWSLEISTSRTPPDPPQANPWTRSRGGLP
jgi:hypothetical protein